MNQKLGRRRRHEIAFEEMRLARIKTCRHDNVPHAIRGFALCDDCGALLPDEDPDLATKFNA
jgi:hypothetical protein